MKHAQFEDVSSRLREEMEILFDPDGPYFPAWIRVHDIDVPSTPSSTLRYYTWSYSYEPIVAPLYYAALCGFHELAEHLIDNCSQDVAVRGGHCISPLPAALVRGHFKTARLLYERGGDIHVLSQGGRYGRRTLLHASSITGQIELVQWLLSHDADPNFREQNGRTPLHLAAHNGRLEVVQMLLQHNADTNMRGDDCQTPLHRASEHRYPDVARLLLEHGAEINARDMDGSTPLHMVLQNKSRSSGSRPTTKEGVFEVARLLIEHGADLRAEDSDGKTLFQVALDRDVVQLLSELGTK